MRRTATLIHDFLEHSTNERPHHTAIIHGDTRMTYRELQEASHTIALWLQQQGIVPGDRVVLLMENSPHYVVGYYGILMAGGVAVPLHAGTKPAALRDLLRRVDPRSLFVSAASERAVLATDLSELGITTCLSFGAGPSRSDLPDPFHRWPLHQDDLPDHFTAPTLTPDSLSSIIFTSASTGEAKGVMLSHYNVVSNTNAIRESLAITREDIQMVVLPFTYVMGKSLLNTHIAAGATIVLNNTFAYPATVVDEMVRERVTAFSGVPSTYAYLLHRSPFRARSRELSHLRYCSQAGGHMPARLKRDLLAALPENTQLYIMYGATEAAARLTCLPPRRLEDKIDSIGLPIPGVEMMVLDRDGARVAAGTVGELVARGPNIMQGYWKDPAATDAVLDEKGYHTGDLGYADAEGFLYVTGRKDNLLKVAGHRIDPRDTEEALLDSDLLMEVAVLGIPDDLQGHRLIALTVFKDADGTTEALLRHAATLLPKHKLPSEIRTVRSIPKTPSGKIDAKACLTLCS